MVYNSAQCNMKKGLLFIASIIMALVLSSGCTKVVTQSNVYEFNITYSNAADKQSVTGNYTGLNGQISSTDAILVYIYVGNTSGEDIWMSLPAHIDTYSYDYAYTDNGIFVFSADAGEGYTWTKDFTLKYRVIRIPNIAVVSKSIEELRASDYNTVMKELNLYETQVIRNR